MAEVTAETLFKEFKSVPLSEFFRKNRQYLGYVGKIKSLTTVIHELLTNSLDACEESGILPDIKVKIDELGEGHYKVSCEDNGPGIPAQHIEQVFGQLLTGTKFHRNIQLRGQQGLGVSGAVLFSQITTGQPARIKSGTGKGKVVDAKIELDIKTNSPKVVEKEEYTDSWRGTLVEAQFKNVQYTKGSKGPFEYVRWTAAANPHAHIYFKDPEGNKTEFERVIEKVPRTPKEQKPHPEGLEAHDILELSHKSKARQVATFLTSDLSRISSQKVREIEAVIAKEYEKEGKEPFDLRKSPRRLEWNEAEKLVQAFKKVKFMAPPTAGLIPIGEKVIEKALQNLLSPDFVKAITRNPTVYKGGIPFMIEAAIAYGGNAGKPSSEEETRKAELMRFANRAPLLFDAGACVINTAMQSIEWRRYHIPDLESAPITIFINLISTHVPYTSAGKQAVAAEDEVNAEIRFALMQIARELQHFLSGKRRAFESAEKKKMFERYIPETAKAISKLTGENAEAIQKNLEEIVFKRFKDILKMEEKPEEELGEEEKEEEKPKEEEFEEEV